MYLKIIILIAYLELFNTLWDFYLELYDERGVMLVMEDGAPIHRSKVAKDFRSSNHMETLDHPAQSPDLKPIDHLWHHLKVMFHKRIAYPQTWMSFGVLCRRSG